jgi:hypothetical protein
MSTARYFSILIAALVAGLWINVMHHTQISQKWQSANLKFDEIKTQLEHLESVCAKR